MKNGGSCSEPATLTRPSPLVPKRLEKFELTVNLKAAKALGLEVPATLIATADEVIE